MGNINTERKMVHFSSRLYEDELQELRRLARKMAVEQDKDIHIADLIREAILAHYFQKK